LTDPILKKLAGGVGQVQTPVLKKEKKKCKSHYSKKSPQDNSKDV
jgi:hypothetical protein